MRTLLPMLLATSLACGGLATPTAATDLAPAAEALPGWLGIVTAADTVYVPWEDPFQEAVPGGSFLIAGHLVTHPVVFEGVGPQEDLCGDSYGARFSGTGLPLGETWLAPPDLRVLRTSIEPMEAPGGTAATWQFGEGHIYMRLGEDGVGNVMVSQDDPIGRFTFTTTATDLGQEHGIPHPVAFFDVGPNYYLLLRTQTGTRRTYQLRELGPEMLVVYETSLEGC